MRLPLGLGAVAEYLAQLVFLGFLVAAVVLRETSVFTIGFFLFVALRISVFIIGRLEPDTRDPVTVMQLRRYGTRE